MSFNFVESEFPYLVKTTGSLQVFSQCTFFRNNPDNPRTISCINGSKTVSREGVVWRGEPKTNSCVNCPLTQNPL